MCECQSFIITLNSCTSDSLTLSFLLSFLLLRNSKSHRKRPDLFHRNSFSAYLAEIKRNWKGKRTQFTKIYTKSYNYKFKRIFFNNFQHSCTTCRLPSYTVCITTWPIRTWQTLTQLLTSYYFSCESELLELYFRY